MVRRLRYLARPWIGKWRARFVPQRGPEMNYETPSYSGANRSVDERVVYLEAKVEYLLDEVSQMRSLLRHLVAEKMDTLPIFQQTRDSFDYQWRNLPEGHAMPSSEA